MRFFGYTISRLPTATSHEKQYNKVMDKVARQANDLEESGAQIAGALAVLQDDLTRVNNLRVRCAKLLGG